MPRQTILHPEGTGGVPERLYRGRITKFVVFSVVVFVALGLFVGATATGKVIIASLLALIALVILLGQWLANP